MSMPMQFDRPAPPGDQFTLETHVGSLLVIEVLEHVPPMLTKVSDKPQDSIRANVYVISPNGTVAEEFANTLLWPRVIVSRLRQSVGRTVLGVLTGQPNVKRDGKNVPYDLDDPTDAMEQVAVRAMSARQLQRPQQAPQSDPWAAQQAPPGWAGAPQQPATPWGAPPVQQPPPQGQPWTGQYAPQPPQQQEPAPWGTPPPQSAAVYQQAQPQGQPWTGQYAPQPQEPAPPVQQPQPAQQELPPWEQDQPAPWGGQQ